MPDSCTHVATVGVKGLKLPKWPTAVQSLSSVETATQLVLQTFHFSPLQPAFNSLNVYSEHLILIFFDHIPFGNESCFSHLRESDYKTIKYTIATFTGLHFQFCLLMFIYVHLWLTKMAIRTLKIYHSIEGKSILLFDEKARDRTDLGMHHLSPFSVISIYGNITHFCQFIVCKATAVLSCFKSNYTRI